MNTFFFSKLESEGLASVERWIPTDKNIFQSSLVLMPIHQSVHWSLLVIVNPGKVKTGETFILHFDSLKSQALHNREVLSKHLFDWLNHHADNSNQFCPGGGRGRRPKAFKKQNVSVYSMVVPQQPPENGVDCGVFALKYAEAVLVSRPDKLDLKMNGMSNAKQVKQFARDNNVFHFDMKDINDFRRLIEMQTTHNR